MSELIRFSGILCDLLNEDLDEQKYAYDPRSASDLELADNVVMDCILIAAKACGDQHLIKIDNDDFTIQHPLIERFQEGVLSCQAHIKHLDWALDLNNPWIMVDGVFYLNDDGSVGEKIAD